MEPKHVLFDSVIVRAPFRSVKMAKMDTVKFSEPRNGAVRELDEYFAVVGELCVREREKLLGLHDKKLAVQRDPVVVLGANSFEQCILEQRLCDCA